MRVPSFLIDANFVGLMSFSVHGLESNAFGVATKKSCRCDGMDGIGFIEFSNKKWRQAV
jgi:hypothetical protein